MASCVSTYTPQQAVVALHQIPHANISFQEAGDTVEGTLDYFEAVIIWSCLPLLVGLVIFILLMVYNCLVCYCCCPEEIYHSKKKAKICAAVGMIWIVTGIIFIGGCLYIEVELNRNVGKLANFVHETQVSQENTQRLARSISNSDFSIAINNVIGGSDQSVADEGSRLRTLGMQLMSSHTAVGNIASAYKLKPTSEQLPLTETARHWAVMAYLIMLALIFIVLFVSFLCMKVQFLLCMLVLCTIFMVITWFGVALGFAGTIVLADFCFDSEGTFRRTQDPSVQSQVDYYLVCSSGCNNSYGTIGMNMSALYADIGSSIDIIDRMLQPSDGAQDHLNDISDMMTASNASYKLVEPLFTCDSTNAMFVDARDSACGVGFIYMLSLFAIFCGLAIVMTLLLCQGTAYFGFLRATEDEGLYDFTTKTDTFLPKNFDGDYASSTWTRPQPAMLGGGAMSTDIGTSTVVEVEPNGQQQQRMENHELQEFDTLNYRVTEPPAYTDAFEEIDVGSDHVPQVEHAVFDDV